MTKPPLKSNTLKSHINKIILLLIFFMFFYFLDQLVDYFNIKVLKDLRKTFEMILFSLISLASASLIIRLTEHRVYHLLELGSDAILLTKSYSFLVYSFFLSLIFWKLGLSIQNITIFLGLITTGFAFAVRDFIGSYLVWFIILSKRPFVIEDCIRIDKTEGVVKRIGTFYTTVRDIDDRNTIKIPNITLLQKPLLNMGHNRISREYIIYLKQIPSDFSERLIAIRKFILTYTSDPKSLVVKLDTNGPNCFLKISFQLSLKNAAIPTKILHDIYTKHADIILIKID